MWHFSIPFCFVDVINMIFIFNFIKSKKKKEGWFIWDKRLWSRVEAGGRGRDLYNFLIKI